MASATPSAADGALGADRFTSTSPGVIAVARAYDHLSDAEVTDQYIKTVRAVTDTKNIWAFWHAGWDGIVGWRQRIAIDWVRRQGPGWELRILDNVDDSPWNYTKWLPAHYFPPSVHDGSILRHDSHAVQHISDFVRTALLVEYGGVWMDIGMVLSRNLEDVCWQQISRPDDALEVCVGAQTDDHGPNIIINSFIAALPGNAFVRNWGKTFLALWANGATSTTDFHSSPLLHNFPQIPIAPNWTEAFGAELTGGMLNDYASHSLSAARLCCLAEPTPGGWDGPAYIRAHMRTLDMFEYFPFNTLWCGASGYDEPRQYELLLLPRPADPAVRNADVAQRDAERLCEGSLASATFTKRASGLHALPSVAKLWTANPGSDCGPGTWGEYLRWARVHVNQTHRALKLWAPGEPYMRSGWSTCWRVGLLEPVTETTEKFTIANVSVTS